MPDPNRRAAEINHIVSSQKRSRNDSGRNKQRHYRRPIANSGRLSRRTSILTHARGGRAALYGSLRCLWLTEDKRTLKSRGRMAG